MSYIFVDSDTEEHESHSRRPGRPPVRKATRKIIVSQRRDSTSSSPIPLSSTTSLKKIVLSESELRSHIKKNMKRDFYSYDDYMTDGKDFSLRNTKKSIKTNSLKRKNRSNRCLNADKSVGGRKRDKVWEHFEDLGQSINGRFRKAKCVYCEQVFLTSKANLMVRHLAHKCSLCPKDIIDEYLNKLKTNSKLNSVEKEPSFVTESNVRSGGRPRGKAWKHFEDLGRSEHGTFRIAKCLFCCTIFPISKLKLLNKHLAKECVLCPEKVMTEFCDQTINNTVISFSDKEDNCDNEEVVEEEEEQSSEYSLKLCGRRRAKVWEHYRDMGRAKHGSFRKAKCIYCNSLFPLSRLTSMTRHLAKCCVLCPKEVVNEYLTEYNNYCSKRSTDYEFIDCNDSNDNDFEGNNEMIFCEELNTS